MGKGEVVDVGDGESWGAVKDARDELAKRSVRVRAVALGVPYYNTKRKERSCKEWKVLWQGTEAL